MRPRRLGPSSLVLLLPIVGLAGFPAACASAQTVDAPRIASAAGNEDDLLRPPSRATIDPTIPSGSPLPAAATRQAVEDDSHLTVTGVAEVQAPPDRVRLHFAVETDGPTAREAGTRNAELMTEVTDALRSAGDAVDGFRLETSGYALTPRYGPPRPNQAQEIVGYIARNMVQIVANDVETAGPFIDAALGAGANRVAGLQFEVSEPEPYRHEAVREAVRSARAEAEVIAAALGMQLGPAVDVQGGADTYFPRGGLATMARMEMAADAATPVEAGLQTLSARVTVRFRLDPLP